MTDTFTWKAHSTSSGGGKFAVYEAKFGDGYMQSAPQGINPDMQNWNITVSGYEDEVQAIIDFLRAHIGASFYWTPPFSTQGYFQCRDYNPHHEGGGFYTLTMAFFQVGAP